jgi:outer membrane protein TolC
MTIRTCVFAITCIFMVLSVSFGEEGTTPPLDVSQEPALPVEVLQGSVPPVEAFQQSASPLEEGVQEPTPPLDTAQESAPSVEAPQESFPPVEGIQESAPSVEGAQASAPPLEEAQVSPSLSLKQSIEIALQKSPTLQAAQGAIKEAKYRRLGTISDFLPQVSTQYTYTRLDAPPLLSIPSLGITAQTGTRDVYTWTNSVTQPVFTGGALINSYLLAKIGVDIARVEFEQTKLDLILQVKEAYYAVLTAEKGVEVAEQTVAQLESNLTVAQAFFEVGVTAKNDLLQVEVSMAQARQFLITAQNALEVARAVFNTLLRRSINEPVRLVEALEYAPMTIDVDLLIEEALRERPELTLSELGIQSAKKGVGVAASKLFPQVSILFNYERQGDEPAVNGSRFQHDADSWNVMGVAQWNVWDWGKAWWGVGENKAKVFQAERALDEVKDSVRLDVQAASLSVMEAEKNILVAETALSQAEENFRINEERYKGQVATSTDVLDALTLLVQSKTNYYKALSDYNVSKARLQRAIGGM